MILQIKFNIVLTSKYTSSFTLKVLFCCIISTTMHENKFKTLLCVKMAICYDIAFSTQKYWRIFISGNIFFLRFQNGTVKRYHFTIIIKKDFKCFSLISTDEDLYKFLHFQTILEDVDYKTILSKYM